jgi:hypothetical protein
LFKSAAFFIIENLFRASGILTSDGFPVSLENTTQQIKINRTAIFRLSSGDISVPIAPVGVCKVLVHPDKRSNCGILRNLERNEKFYEKI